MRITGINNNYKPNFGYDKNLSSELRHSLAVYPDKNWAATLITLSAECNAVESVMRQEETKKKPRKMDEYTDIFLTLKQMLAGFVSETFENMNYAQREIDSYRDEFVKNGSNPDDWRGEVIEALSVWTDNPSENTKVQDGIVAGVDKLSASKSDENTKEVNKSDNKNSSSALEMIKKKSISKLSKDSLLEEFIPSKTTPKRFADVAGMNKLKKDLDEGIIQYINNPEQAKSDFEEYGKEMPKAILLYGPPGCGKTYITQALAGEAEVPLYLLNIGKAGSSYINQTSQNIKSAFDEAVKLSQNSEKPFLIFMDEIDTLGFDRNSGREAEDLKQVGTMLQSMDNAKQSNIILIGATNKYDILDPALRRRFDSKVFVGLPDKESLIALLVKNLTSYSKGKNLAENDEDLNKIADMLSGYSNSSVCNISKSAALNAMNRNRADISLEDYEKAIKESSEEKPKTDDYLGENLKTKKKIGFKL